MLFLGWRKWGEGSEGCFMSEEEGNKGVRVRGDERGF